ncbi:hypothetical protein [Pseudomonas sp.]|uniref:hypothetical protein n=1 Tax=Pseudomonas sp. TaxID=306 RepID=UPI003D10BFA3
MHKIDGYGATPTNTFTEGSPGPVPVPPTYVTADWANAVQGELVAAIQGAGIVLDKADNTQLLAAILALAAGGAGGVKVVTFAESPYAVQTSDGVLLVDASGGAVVIQFLDASVGGAKRLTVKKTDVTENAVQCTPQAAQEVEGEAGSYDSVMPGEFMSFVPDGASAWHRVG